MYSVESSKTLGKFFKMRSNIQYIHVVEQALILSADVNFFSDISVWTSVVALQASVLDCPENSLSKGRKAQSRLCAFISDSSQSHAIVSGLRKFLLSSPLVNSTLCNTVA
jgi:hypothetical protein